MNKIWLGLNGLNIIFMFASSGVLSPLRLLQFVQAVIRFSQVSSPPLALGKT